MQGKMKPALAKTSVKGDAGANSCVIEVALSCEAQYANVLAG